MDKSTTKSLLVLVPVTLLLAGTCGFVLIEGWNLLDGLYMTIVTFSTVGYSETHELSLVGRVFTGLLILVSMVCVTGWTAMWTGMIVSGEVSGNFERRRKAKMIKKLDGHTIVCGDGLLAQIIVVELARRGLPIVFVSNSQEVVNQVRRFAGDSVLTLEDEPTSELALADANILKCKTVVAAMQSDVDNLMIAITAKGIRESIDLFSCAQGTEYATRMTKVGADHVVSPFELGGRYLANLISGSEDQTDIAQLLSV